MFCAWRYPRSRSPTRATRGWPATGRSKSGPHRGRPLRRRERAGRAPSARQRPRDELRAADARRGSRRWPTRWPGPFPVYLARRRRCWTPSRAFTSTAVAWRIGQPSGGRGLPAARAPSSCSRISSTSTTWAPSRATPPPSAPTRWSCRPRCADPVLPQGDPRLDRRRVQAARRRARAVARGPGALRDRGSPLFGAVLDGDAVPLARVRARRRGRRCCSAPRARALAGRPRRLRPPDHDPHGGRRGLAERRDRRRVTLFQL